MPQVKNQSIVIQRQLPWYLNWKYLTEDLVLEANERTVAANGADAWWEEERDV